MKNSRAIQKEINDLQREQTLLSARLKNTEDESAKAFLQNLINYNEELINDLVSKQTLKL